MLNFEFDFDFLNIKWEKLKCVIRINKRQLFPKLNMTDYKQLIIDSLDILRKRDIADKQPFKARAYSKVISQLQSLSTPIYSYSDVESIDGIGDKISKKIKEVLETGIMKSAEKAKENYNIDALDALQNIYGVGPSKASDLVKSGISSVQQLRECILHNPKLLNEKQKIGLRYYEELLERIPRDEMEEHSDILHSLIPHEMELYTIDIVGSFRRGATSSGDIDVLIRIPDDTSDTESKTYLAMYVKALQRFGYIKEILALGEHKCMAISKMYNGKARRLDLLMTPANQYPFAILYFTGSDKFNVAFRQYALDKGYTLNEHSLTPIKGDLDVPPFMKSEKDIFTFLGLRYIEPSKRIDSHQIIPMRLKPKVAPT